MNPTGSPAADLHPDRGKARRHPLFARFYARIVPVMDEGGVAEHLAAPDAAFDAAVACMTLCSVRDQDAALAEMFRVLRPGGRLHVFEHVRAQTPGLRRVQRVLDATRAPGAVDHADGPAELGAPRGRGPSGQISRRSSSAGTAR